VRLAESRRRADEWATVLAAADIPHWLRHRLDGWALMVPATAAPAALETLAAYDRENAPEPASDAAGRVRPVSIAGVVVALLLLGFFAITGPRAARNPWFAQGSADAARILAGDWWRTVTALTLHADAPHVLGNALGCAVLGSAVIQLLGPGLGLVLLLLAGASGNALTAAVHGSGHASVGASTAIFGAVGILAALRVTRGGPGPRRERWWVVLGACLLFLVLLGGGPNTDHMAHLFGLLGGAVLGVLTGLTLRAPLPAAAQALLVAAAAASVVAAWRAAVA
jgi:membrane associated rhomboid family serine protease